MPSIPIYLLHCLNVEKKRWMSRASDVRLINGHFSSAIVDRIYVAVLLSYKV